jgi:hypothetical protein
MKAKTSELSGRSLNLAMTLLELKRVEAAGENIKSWWKDEVLSGQRADPYSTDWLWGGPIIDREKIELHYEYGDQEWKAVQFLKDEWCCQHGPTPLIAAMRCYVASRLGDEINVPDEVLT